MHLWIVRFYWMRISNPKNEELTIGLRHNLLVLCEETQILLTLTGWYRRLWHCIIVPLYPPVVWCHTDSLTSHPLTLIFVSSSSNRSDGPRQLSACLCFCFFQLFRRWWWLSSQWMWLHTYNPIYKIPVNDQCSWIRDNNCEFVVATQAPCAIQ